MKHMYNNSLPETWFTIKLDKEENNNSIFGLGNYIFVNLPWSPWIFVIADVMQFFPKWIFSFQYYFLANFGEKLDSAE